MKRILGVALIGLPVLALGCPIYPASDKMQRYCSGGQCYACPDSTTWSTDCTSWQCGTSADCPSDYACTSAGECSPVPTDAGALRGCATPQECATSHQTCGSDSRCHSGDCSSVGCPAGYVCQLDQGTLACVGISRGTPGSDAEAPPPVTPAPNDAEAPKPPPCTSSASCAVPGAQCLDGVCVAPDAFCVDGSQCANADERCVDGACIPSCSAQTVCPMGFGCDSRGVCLDNTAPCPTTGQCASASTCVQGHCVPTCGAGDVCARGLVCIGGGCVPPARVKAMCTGEGVQGGCPTASICVREACYVPCTGDAGASSCAASSAASVCKTLAIGTASYSVCAAPTALGDTCDVGHGRPCTPPKRCIDGFCL